MVIRDILLFDKNWEQLAAVVHKDEPKTTIRTARRTNYNDKISQGK